MCVLSSACVRAHVRRAAALPTPPPPPLTFMFGPAGLNCTRGWFCLICRCACLRWNTWGWDWATWLLPGGPLGGGGGRQGVDRLAGRPTHLRSCCPPPTHTHACARAHTSMEVFPDPQRTVYVLLHCPWLWTGLLPDIRAPTPPSPSLQVCPPPATHTHTPVVCLDALRRNIGGQAHTRRHPVILRRVCAPGRLLVRQRRCGPRTEAVQLRAQAVHGPVCACVWKGCVHPGPKLVWMYHGSSPPQSIPYTLHMHTHSHTPTPSTPTLPITRSALCRHAARAVPHLGGLGSSPRPVG